MVSHASLPTSVKEPIATVPVEPQPHAAFIEKGISWLVEAQHTDGGWGGGSHANQQERDPHAVQTDPATTAFAAMALVRAGHTPESGQFKDSVRRATEYLVGVVEQYSESGPRITDVTGTQPQAKLGQLVDTSMTAKFLARVLPTVTEESKLYARVDNALEKCLRKLEGSQQADGSFNVAGWAPVLQSSISSTALELAQVAGKDVDGEVLQRARDYQKGNVNPSTGAAMGGDAAGVELYAFSAGQRANASDAREAEEIVENAKREGKVAASAPVDSATLAQAGVGQGQARSLARAFQQNQAQIRRLDDERLLAGFGSNGGEEFLSYLLTSESLVITGGEAWEKWNTKMHERLAKIQNPDGSWNGYHCISSPVFCTAAVVQCLTTDRDAKLLAQIAATQSDERAGGGE